MIKRLECRILGRVQLVMFRDFVKRKARKLGLVGEVENLKDGSVFVTAEGEEVLLKELLQKIQTGPISAIVKKVEEGWFPTKNEFGDFKLIYYVRR